MDKQKISEKTLRRVTILTPSSNNEKAVYGGIENILEDIQKSITLSVSSLFLGSTTVMDFNTFKSKVKKYNIPKDISDIYSSVKDISSYIKDIANSIKSITNDTVETTNYSEILNKIYNKLDKSDNSSLNESKDNIKVEHNIVLSDLDSLDNVIQSISDNNLQNLSSFIKSLESLSNINPIDNKVIDSLLNFNKLDSLENKKFDISGIHELLHELENLSNTNVPDVEKILNSISEFSKIDTNSLNEVFNSFSNIDINTLLAFGDTLNTIDIDALSKNIIGLSEAINNLSSITDTDTSSLEKIFNPLLNIDTSTTVKKLTDIKKLIENNLEPVIESINMLSLIEDDKKDIITGISSFMDSITTLSSYDIDKIKEAVNSLSNIISNENILDNLIDSINSLSDLENKDNIITALDSFINKLSYLQESDDERITNSLKTLDNALSYDINGLINKINILDEIDTEKNNIINDLKKFILLFTNIEKLNEDDITSSLESINNIISNNIISTIDSINKIQDIEADKSNSIFGILDYFDKLSNIKDSYDEDIHNQIVTNLNNLLSLINIKDKDNLINSVLKSINNLTDISDEGKENIKELSNFFAIFSSIESIDTSKLEENINSLADALKEVETKFNEISKLDFKKNSEQIIKQLDYIEKVLSKKIELTNAAVNNQSKNINTLKDNIDKTKEVALKGSSVDKKTLVESQQNAGKLIDAISTLGLVMLLGGFIITKNEKIIIGSLKFGATLSLFLLELMIPIALLSRISRRLPENAKAMHDLSKFVAETSLVMILGGAIFLIKDGALLKSSLLFGLALGVFLRTLLIPLAIIGRIANGKNLEHVDNLSLLVEELALTMIIGGAVMALGGGKYVADAMAFGIALAKFIAIVTLPLMLYGRIFKPVLDKVEGFTKIIRTATISMILGAAVMALGGGKYVADALKFGMVLGLFIGMVLFPVFLYSRRLAAAGQAINKITLFVTVASTLLIIGALVGRNRELIKGALLFSGVLFTYISLTLLPFIFFGRTVDRLYKTLFNFVVFTSFASTLLYVGAAVINERPELIEQALKFTAVLSAFILGIGISFKILGALSNNILKATLAILTISASIALLTTTFILVSKNVDKINFKSILNFLAITGIITGVVIGIGLLSSAIGFGVSAALGVGLFVTILAGSLFLMDFIVHKIDLIEDIAILKLAIISAGEAFKETGKYAGWIALGSLVAVLMAVGLSALSVAFGIAHVLTSKFNATEDFEKLKAAIEGAGVTFTFLGELALPILFGSIVSGFLAGGLIALGIGFTILHYLVENTTPVEDIKIIDTAVVNIGKTFGKLGAVAGAIALGTVSSILLAVGAAALALSFGILKAVQKIDIEDAVEQSIKNVDQIKYLMEYVEENIGGWDAIKLRVRIRNVRKIMKNLALSFKSLKSIMKIAKDVDTDFKPEIIAKLISVFGDKAIIKSIKEADKHEKDYKKFRKTIKGTVNIISKLGKTISNFSKLTIPIYDENGKEIGKRNLTGADFTNAARNIANIITTISGAISNVYNDPRNKDLFNADVSRGIVNLFAPKKNKFDVVLSSISNLGKAVSSIGKGLISFANLQFPIEFDEYGNPTKYLTVTDDTFSVVGENISKVITTLVNAIIKAYENPDFAEMINSEVASGGLLGAIVGKKNKFDKVVGGIKHLGDAISSIAKGLVSYAQMKIPTGFDAQGNPTGYTQLTDSFINSAVSNIEKVILTMATAIANVYDNNFELFNSEVSTGFFRRIFSGKKNKFDVALAASMNIGDLISKLSTGLVAMSELKFPIYDSAGNIVGYNTITNGDLTKAAQNIAIILTTVTKGISDAYESFSNQDKINKVFESFEEIGNLISNISQGIVAYTSMSIPKYDSEGKIIGTTPITEDTKLTAAKNIASIINTVMDAISSSYDSLSSKAKKKLPKIIDSYSEIGEIIANIAQGIQAYANSGIPIYDENGKIKGKIQFKETDVEEYSKFLNTVISTSINSIAIAYESNKKFLERNKKAIKELSKNSKSISETIINLFDVVQAFANLYIPASYNEDGSIKERVRFDSSIINSMENNLKILISALPNAILSIADTSKKDLKSITRVDNILKEVSEILLLVSGEYFDNIVEVSSKINAITSSQNLNDIFSNVEILVTAFIGLSNNLIDFVNKLKLSTNAKFNSLGSLISNVSDDIVLIISKISDDLYPILSSSQYMYEWFDDKDNMKNVERVFDGYTKFIKDLFQINKVFLKYQLIDNDIDNILDNVNESIEKIFKFMTYSIKKYNLSKEENKVLKSNIKNIRNLYDELHDLIKYISRKANVKDEKLEQITVFNDVINGLFSGIDFILSRNLLDNIHEINTIVLPLLSKIGEVYLKLTDIFNGNIQENTLSSIMSNNIGDFYEIMSLTSKVQDFSNALEILAQMSFVAAESKLNGFEIIAEGLGSIDEKVRDLTDENNTRFKNHAEALSDYVKTINAIDLQKLDRMQKFVDSISELSEKLGNLDKVTDVLANKIAATLETLSNKLDEAAKTIHDADELQKSRHELISSSIEEVKQIMNQTLTIDVKNVKEDNGIKAAWETPNNEGTIKK